MNNLNSLRGEAAFYKLFLLCKKKYESLGRIGGSVSLKTFTDTEIVAISGLTGISSDKLFEKQSLALITIERALAETKFEYDSLLTFLEDYFDEVLVGKKEREQLEREREVEFCEQVKKQLPQIDWYIDWITEKPADARWIWGLYKENPEVVAKQLSVLNNAYILLLEGRSYERLPLFAQRITGNPHAFDRNEILGKWLLHLLTVDQAVKGVDLSFSKSTEEENDLLGQYRLLRDDLWSFVTLKNLIAETGGNKHPVWLAANETETVLNLPLKELIKIDTAYPLSGSTVWVVENSSVASTLMDIVPHAAIICTHGQLRLAGWRLIEMLTARGVRIYYSGDLDPEGLLIADRLTGRFKEKVELWRMDESTYRKRMSDEQLSDVRLSKLDRLHHPQLQKVAELMREHKRPTYQEAMVEAMVEDMQSGG